MKKIPLVGKPGKGLFAVVDDDDYARLSPYTWSLNVSGYPRRRTSFKREGRWIGTDILLHRLVMGAKPHQHVDHRNHDKLDARKAFLRICTPSQNHANRVRSPLNTSGFKGAQLDKANRNYTMQLKRHRVYTFRTVRQAAMAYDLWAVDLFGDFALTNFKVVLHSNKKRPAA